MTEPFFDETIIAPCGMNCGVCKAHLRRKSPCHGCRDAEQNRPKTRASCRMRLCEKRTGAFCYDCADFPCDRLRHLDTRYRARYGLSEIENLEFIRDHGMERFLEKEQSRWVSARGVLCIHDTAWYPIAGNGRDLSG